MRIGPKPKGMCSTPLGQAKFALRTYVMHQYYGISPTCWWSFDGGREKLGTIEWGFVCAEGGVRLRGMIVRDYPLCLRYSHLAGL